MSENHVKYEDSKILLATLLNELTCQNLDFTVFHKAPSIGRRKMQIFHINVNFGRVHWNGCIECIEIFYIFLLKFSLLYLEGNNIKLTDNSLSGLNLTHKL